MSQETRERLRLVEYLILPRITEISTVPLFDKKITHYGPDHLTNSLQISASVARTYYADAAIGQLSSLVLSLNRGLGAGTTAFVCAPGLYHVQIHMRPDRIRDVVRFLTPEEILTTPVTGAKAPASRYLFG